MRMKKMKKILKRKNLRKKKEKIINKKNNKNNKNLQFSINTYKISNFMHKKLNLNLI